MPGVLIRRERDTETQRKYTGKGDHMKMEAEPVVMLPQCRERQRLLAITERRNKEGFFLRCFRGNLALLTPEFQTSSL